MTTAVEAPVAAHETVTRPRPGEWVITLFMLSFFAAAYVIAEDYPFRAALFPQMVSALGFVLCLLRIIGLLRLTLRNRRPPVSTPAPAGAAVPGAAATNAATAATAATADSVTQGEAVATTPVSNLEIVDDDVEDDASMEYVFATAGARAWAAAMAWVVAFFVAFFALGVFVAVPLFAVLYLRFSGRASWWAAILYAGITGALIYVMFRLVVYIDLPTGYIPFLQF